MKSDEQLRKLANNPYYKMTDDEAARLRRLDTLPVENTAEEPKKKPTAKRDSVIVKETGQFNKHGTDIVTE